MSNPKYAEKGHKCPVCGKYYFTDYFEECPVCNWAYDLYQEEYPDKAGCGNYMSLNEAKQAYKDGKEIL